MSGYQVVFGVLLGIGLLWLIVSLVFGDLADLFGGGDVDAGVGGGDVDAGAGGGDVDAGAGGGAQAPGLGGDADQPGASWTSTSIIATALVGIGGAGLAGVSLGLPGPLAIVVGLVIGLGFAYLVLRFVLRPLLRQQANTSISQRTYLGSRATVTLDVARDRVGTVRFTDVNDAVVEVPAVPMNPDEHFARGDLVVIHSMVSGKARVISFDAP